MFAIGDITGIMLTSIGKPLPKAGVFAHYEAEVVANNLVHAITGKGAPQIALKPPSVMRHFGKVLYEKYWLFRWFY